MNNHKKPIKYLALLRGINVGGHHKVPMADLRSVMNDMKFSDLVTILNSGNIIFSSTIDNPKNLQNVISENLEKVFGFPIPAIVKKAKIILELNNEAPFKDVICTEDIRLYASFLKKDTQIDLPLPWISSDNSYKIIACRNNIILSVLDLSLSKTTKAMGVLEKFYGENITTRNWKTLERIVKKL